MSYCGIYQAQISYSLSPAGPVLVSSGSGNKMHPELPDNTFLMSWDGERYAYVIPGSSIKGVMRHYLYRMFSDKKADNLFGTLGSKSKISVSDAFADMDTVKTTVRHSTAINSVSQSAKNGSLNNMQAVVAGIFDGNIHLTDVKQEEIAVVLKAINAIENGEIHIGGKISRGFGRMKVKDFHITISEGYDENLQPIVTEDIHSLSDAIAAHNFSSASVGGNA